MATDWRASGRGRIAFADVELIFLERGFVFGSALAKYSGFSGISILCARILRLRGRLLQANRKRAKTLGATRWCTYRRPIVDSKSSNLAQAIKTLQCLSASMLGTMKYVRKDRKDRRAVVERLGDGLSGGWKKGWKGKREAQSASGFGNGMAEWGMRMGMAGVCESLEP